MDAESETLVNQALSSLLASNNTTISIAHRLSTIQRSDRIICIGADGQVAEQGTYAELSSRDGAFSRLMEWQMSGAGAAEQQRKKAGPPHLSEEEELAYNNEHPEQQQEHHEDEERADQEVDKRPEEKVAEEAASKVGEKKR